MCDLAATFCSLQREASNEKEFTSKACGCSAQRYRAIRGDPGVGNQCIFCTDRNQGGQETPVEAGIQRHNQSSA
jgi:hypothetical protein